MGSGSLFEQLCHLSSPKLSFFIAKMGMRTWQSDGENAYR